MMEEISPNVFRIPVPLPGPLRETNAYFVRGETQHLLVDNGWYGDDSWAILRDALATLGAFDAADEVIHVITHLHPDHSGLTTHVQNSLCTRTYVHPHEMLHLMPRIRNPEGMLSRVASWYATKGVPRSYRDSFAAESKRVFDQPVPDELHSLEGVPPVDQANFSWELRWTPGHSPGHVCLYEPDQGLIISGDHVLQHETPNVSAQPHGASNPLADYLASLEAVREWDVNLVLPGHGEPFATFEGSVTHILSHHDSRLEDVVGVVEAGARTPWDVSRNLTWSNGDFADLDELNQRLALLETLAHLECLRGRGPLRKTYADGTEQYSM